MLGALLVAPVSTPVALAMATSMAHTKMAMPTAGEMPCHKAAHKAAKPKHCPECPQKMCADMTACLAKCFQPMSVPVVQVRMHGLAASSAVPPGLSQASDGSLISPPLRPPSV